MPIDDDELEDFNQGYSAGWTDATAAIRQKQEEEREKKLTVAKIKTMRPEDLVGRKDEVDAAIAADAKERGGAR